MNKFSKIKAVITDFDDTLVPFASLYSSYVNILVEGIAKKAEMSEEEIAKGFNELYVKKGVFQFENALHLHKALSQKFPNEDLSQKFAKEVKAARDGLESACKPVSGTIEGLLELKKRGMKLVLFTASPASFTIDKLRSSGLENIFDHIYAVKDNRDEGQAEIEAKHPSSEWHKVKLFGRGSKLSTKSYKKILKDINVAPKEAVMMGDSAQQDIFMAKKAGLRTIWVKGYSERAKASKNFALVLAKHYSKSIKLLIRKSLLSALNKNIHLFADAIIEYPSQLKNTLIVEKKDMNFFQKLGSKVR